jgi:hypothetical protein
MNARHSKVVERSQTFSDPRSVARMLPKGEFASHETPKVGQPLAAVNVLSES